MKSFILFLLCVEIGAFGMYYFLHQNSPSSKAESISKPALTPTTKPTTDFEVEKAPSESVTASITSLSGEVNWQSRTATQPAAIVSPIKVQQGEIVSTGDKGKADVQLANVLISLQPKSNLDFVQTLKQNFVLAQSSGTIEYTNSGTTPLAVRSLHLLMQLDNATAHISIDSDTDTITMDVEKGSATVAYNDLSIVTNTLTVAAGKRLVFDDDQRDATIKNTP